MEPIQIFEPKFRKEEIIAQITECLDKGWTGLGYKTVEFEKAWSDYTGLEYSHFLSSNTVGLHLALNILKSEGGWNDGDEVLTTPITFVSTNHSILYENLRPVFCDIDDYLCLDPVDLESKITEKTRAVMFVGLGGNPGKLKDIKRICDKYGLKLILDAAHMAGTFVNGKSGPIHVGHEADISVFSFQAVKNLPTADSGMICFKNQEHLEIAKKLTWLGIDKDTFSRVDSTGSYKWKYDVPYIGYKYHGNSIMASMGLVQLKYLDKDNDYRNKLAKYYDYKLKSQDNISLIKNSEYCYKSSRHLYQIKFSEKISRDNAIDFLHSQKIYPGVHYQDNTGYQVYSFASGTCPIAHNSSKQILSLPVHLNLDEKDMDRVVSAISEFIERES